MGKIEVITDLPKNISVEIEHYFLVRQKYKIRKPKVHYLKNAFISEQGLVVKNFLLNRYSAFNLCGREDNTFYLPYWRLSLEQMLVSKFGKSLKSISLKDDKNYILIYSKWFNYSFWINSCLVRLIMAEKKGNLENSLLLYPEGWDNIPFVRDSLQCFNIKKEVIPNDHNMFIKNLVLPETREWTASFYPTQIQEVRERIVPFALERTSLKKFPERIYLTRRKRSVRCVENENEILPVLDSFGYESINFEDFSFWDQVALMNNAKSFISVHGAGFSNVMFMKPGSAVLELINEPYAKVEYQFPFWKLSSAAKLNYFAQFCSLRPEASKLLRRGKNHDSINTYLADENVIVNTELFRENLEKMHSLKEKK
jgi:hypothetical protein